MMMMMRNRRWDTMTWVVTITEGGKEKIPRGRLRPVAIF